MADFSVKKVSKAPHQGAFGRKGIREFPSKESRPVQYQIIHYRKARDRDGNEIEIEHRTDIVTLENLQAQLAGIQAKIDAIKALEK